MDCFTAIASSVSCVAPLPCLTDASESFYSSLSSLPNQKNTLQMMINIAAEQVLTAARHHWILMSEDTAGTEPTSDAFVLLAAMICYT